MSGRDGADDREPEAVVVVARRRQREGDFLQAALASAKTLAASVAATVRGIRFETQ